MKPSILVIRRDNIGDLVCTLPLIRALRQHYPKGRIDALVNSYNQPVVAQHPDLDHVYAYTKAKHRSAGETVVGVYWRRLRLLWTLRRRHYDYVIMANGGLMPRALRLARWVKPREIIGFANGKEGLGKWVDRSVTIRPAQPMHEVENLFRLLGLLNIEQAVPPVAGMRAEPAMVNLVQSRLATLPPAPLTLAIHISSRKPPQRWPAVQFIELMRGLHARHQARFMLFWSPGDEHNPHHPGDDRKAAEIMAAVTDLPVLAYPTEALSELIGGLSVCDAMICSDGGAMHVGAGLGKPIVCFFGNSDATVWRPWGVPYRLLQKPSRDVKDIAADEALAAFIELLPEIKRGSML
ncbi:glycosyltransferase family 9 protein [Leeia sp.]|uniref:glycosyltransferase family 9 protein n=1 Tax=Leeia sp. TaxID=2884678 RepID=UPI0035AE247D